ncbi:7-dehydrocholesterol reductase [Cordyceps militaris]|uniref:7-dehydrocholesterol reductase n=1 Tax=Cordyceps militaris TaxID=73501 RepID=A0A2H4SEA9_CORMI|nr:7-dehydrocholesterol reductase [Cordyceps militaris]
MYEPGANGKVAKALNEATSFLLVTTSPLFCFFCYIAYSDFDASLYAAAVVLVSRGPVAFFSQHLPQTSLNTIFGYARKWPDNEGETLLTDQFWYNLFNGGELHPRTGQFFDWKHFNASRTGGILLWTLIDLSFAAWQVELHQTLTSTMVAAVLFRAIVVVDYFWCEHWFFETLDGSHERFSFYSIYGFAVMMPLLWTLQTQYLALHPVELSWPVVSAAYVVFAFGFLLNHDANEQRAASRRKSGQVTIWGKPARYVKAQYSTTDGKTHQTILLCSGK